MKAFIIVPVYGAHGSFLQCIEAAVRHTDLDHQILVIDDASPTGEDDVATLLKSRNLLNRVVLLRNESNIGFVRTVNKGIALAPTEDYVVILNSDVVVGPRWLENLIRTASRSDLIATVSAITNNGANASVRLDREGLEPNDFEKLDEINCALQGYPVLPLVTLPVGVGHCMLITPRARAAVGFLSEEFGHGYGEEVDFSLRATKLGFIHVLGTETFVWHVGSQSFGERGLALQARNEELLRGKYKGYYSFVHTYEQRQDLALTAFSRVLIASRGLRVVIDGRMIHGARTGAATVALELARNLSVLERNVSVTLVASDSVAKSLPTDNFPVEVVPVSQVNEWVVTNDRADIVFRPGQISTVDDLKVMWGWARRVAVLQLDFIAFDNWFYHPSVESFRHFQDANQICAIFADAMFYLTETIFLESARTAPRLGGAADIKSFDLGTDHIERIALSNSDRPARVLVIGAAFAHKNRSYAILLASEAAKILGRMIELILVGPEPTVGGSTEHDKQIAIESDHPLINFRFYPWLPDDELRGLLDSSSVVIYPSLSEGFGLVPFEAAARGAAPLAPLHSSMAETLAGVPYSLSLTDLQADARILADLVNSPARRSEQIDFLNHRTQRYLWPTVAAKLAEHLETAAVLPPRIPTMIRNQLLFAPSGARPPLAVRVRASRVGLTLFPPFSRQSELAKRLYLRFWRR